MSLEPDPAGGAALEIGRLRTRRSLGDKLLLATARWFGAGCAPKAPGTFGSLAAVPLAGLLMRAHVLVYWAVAAGIVGLGIHASQRASELLGEEDPQSVVIDEVAGVMLSLGFVLSGPLWTQALAFVLFRWLDITKPGPIFRVQFVQPAGLGIMADDVLAGLGAGLLARVALETATLVASS